MSRRSSYSHLRQFLTFISILFLIFLSSPLFASDGNIISNLNSFVESRLSGSEFTLSSALFLMLGGLLASLLPCVYPLYPITVGILRKRGEGTSRFLHPVVYYLGLALMYMIFGSIAGLTGGAFNTILRQPLTNLMISFMIFLLGLSSIELIMLPLFGGRGMQKNKGGIFGTLVMGMGAGLLSSPCVGPVVVTILLGIAVSSAGILSGGLIAFASLKMFLFGLGVGFPFLLVGVFGMSLPKSGSWLRYVQLSLGTVVFYFAYTYYVKAMDGWNFDEGKAHLILGGYLMILISSFYFQPAERPGFEKMRQSLTISGMVVGAILIFGGIRTTTPAVAATTSGDSIMIPSSAEMEKDGNLSWFRKKDEAYETARLQNKPVFIDFYADWCTNCKEFKKLSLSNKDLNEALGKVILLKVEDTDDQFEYFESRHPELLVGLPFFVITDPRGNMVFKTTDYLNTKGMIDHLH